MKSLQDEEPAIEKMRTWKRKAWMKRELERAANSLQQQDFTTPETATNEPTWRGRPVPEKTPVLLQRPGTIDTREA